VRYRRLGFEELRRLAEFRGGVLAADISRLLREDPRHNTAFQQWWFAQAAPEGKFDLSQRMYRLLDELLGSGRVRSLVDLGCNSGEVVAAAAGRGVEALGVDLPEVVRRITLPIKTMALDLNRAFPPGTYDAILCREVFEHVSDADAFLARCAGIAHRGTVLLPSCPYTARQFDGNAFHLRVLSAAELRQAVERHGFLVRDLFREHESHVIVAERGGPR
jgi:2-polyprenyl-3-methyl-5-hydroxy-6-metoxy-1,4-benzoquinol methylase